MGICVHLCVCTCVFMSCTFVCNSVCLYVCIHVLLCISVCVLCVCMHVFVLARECHNKYEKVRTQPSKTILPHCVIQGLKSGSERFNGIYIYSLSSFAVPLDVY